MITDILHRNQVMYVSRLFLVCLAIMSCFFRAIAQPMDSKNSEQVKLFKKALRAYPVSQSAKRLDLLFSFPQEETLNVDIGLWAASYIETDEDGNLYISDSRAHRVLVFDNSGSFIYQFGKKGQAPGEFNMPRGIAYDGEHLIINDTGNHRLQFFSKSGRHIRSFLVNKTYYEIAASANGMIYAAPIRMDNSDPLVDAFNQEGRIVFSFGVGKKYTNWQQLNWVRISASANNIFIAFQYFPILQVYSNSGLLLNESNFGRGFMKEQVRINISRDRKNDPVRTGFINIIQDIKHYNGRALVLVGHPRVEILEFDNEGRLIDSWWAEKAYDCVDVAFACRPGSPKRRFYVLRLYPENIVQALEQVR